MLQKISNRQFLLSALAVMLSLGLMAQNAPVIQKAKYFRKSIPLRDMAKVPPGPKDQRWKDGIVRNEENPKANREAKEGPLPLGSDPVWQDFQGELLQGRAAITNFDGVGNVNSVYPPDTDGDVGPNHYFQMINLSFAIYDKEGNQLYGPVNNSTLWAGFIGPWTGTNDGDPIVLYDEQADRWLASQFAINTSNGTYWELIAISETGDPMGAYYQYAFEFPAFNDYPKFGIWHDGYYASFNMFGSYYRGAAAAFEKSKMLVGDSTAIMVLFDMPEGSDASNMLPSDYDGQNAPPAGTPNYFIYFNDDAWGYNNDQLRLWEFDVDWSTPANSTFQEVSTLITEPFDSKICEAQRWQCIPQPNTGRKLEAISDRMMFRLQYRNFGTYQVMVTNHTVDVDDGHAGVRWYELRDNNDGNGWFIYQQGTYAPDANHRWMGSIAMNGLGNIALGYTVSSDSISPSVRYTGRTSNAPLGQMNIAEVELIRGTGSQSSISRWGDYSCMSVDPSDDTTFWYTQEYMGGGWRTRISAFDFNPVTHATADAGPDDFVCENSIFTTNGSATNYNSIRWESRGDGVFGNNSSLQAPYWRGSGDLGQGSVILDLTAYGYQPGQHASDSMILFFRYLPEVSAGNDTIICQNEILTLNPEILNSDSVYWTTSGDGQFDQDTLLNASYTPGQEDIENGQVVLTLNAMPVAPCDDMKSDDVNVTIDECTSIHDMYTSSGDVKIIPNPNQGMFRVVLKPGAGESVNLQITSIEGKSVLNKTYGNASDGLDLQIDLSGQPRGIYFLSLSSNEKNFIQKIILN